MVCNNRKDKIKMDIFYFSRCKNSVIGWNWKKDKKVYERKFKDVNEAKIIMTWARQYISVNGWLTDHATNINADYIIKNIVQ
jgi:hypothetical protein